MKRECFEQDKNCIECPDYRRRQYAGRCGDEDEDADPDLLEAAKELDAEFPGADYDESLQKYLNKKESQKRIIKKLIFHGVFYSCCIIGIHLLYNTNIFNSLVCALTYFLVYILIKHSLSAKKQKTYYGQFKDAIK